MKYIVGMTKNVRLRMSYSRHLPRGSVAFQETEFFVNFVIKDRVFLPRFSYLSHSRSKKQKNKQKNIHLEKIFKRKEICTRLLPKTITNMLHKFYVNLNIFSIILQSVSNKWRAKISFLLKIYFWSTFQKSKHI